ncbi:MAG: phospholipase D-like domain-containing protein, partial [candidate division WOR-3 bacterium]
TVLSGCFGGSKLEAPKTLTDDIQVFFTREDTVLNVIVGLINSSRKTLQIAIYEIDHPDIVRAIIEAKKRGVKVEMVMDDRMKKEWAAKKLEKEGIPIVFDNREPYMHNKFAVIDSQLILTGSTNFKESEIYRNDNNLVVINSRLIAENYLREFYEMFEDKKFGALSPRNTDCCFKVGPYRVEVYFSPEDDVEARIIKIVNMARKNIKFAAFSFSDNELGNALVYAKKRGVNVAGVIESKSVKNRGSEYNKFVKNGIDVLRDGNPYNMHSKYIIVDDSIVITGSYNFSRNAQELNDENVVIIFSKAMAERFSKNFNRIYGEAKMR